MSDCYKTIKCYAEASFTVERSKFIGCAKPVSSEAEALAFIKEIKSKHYDAKHNVYAYLLRENHTGRYSDDGEPSGTAGLPVFDVLRKEGITDSVIVVTRYFGGILLGTGGLVRAYTKSAKLALGKAEICEMRLCTAYETFCEYGFYDKFIKFLSKNKAYVTDSDFSDKVKISFYIDNAGKKDFQVKVTDFSNGAMHLQETDVFYQPLSSGSNLIG